MKSLKQIIKEDACKVKDIVGPPIIGLAKGFFNGIYTPALMNTGLKQFSNRMSIHNDRTEWEGAFDLIAYIPTSFAAFYLSLDYAIEKRRVLEYFGALAVTNLIDYFVHAYKRSKKPKGSSF